MCATLQRIHVAVNNSYFMFRDTRIHLSVKSKGAVIPEVVNITCPPKTTLTRLSAPPRYVCVYVRVH